MAYLQKLDKDDETTNGQQGSDASAPSSNPVNISGSDASTAESTGGSNKSASSDAPAYAPAATKSGSFQNIQNYLDANAGFNGGQGLAGKAYGDLKDQSEQQQNAIGTSQNQFNTTAQQAGGQYDPSKVNSFVSQATSDPVAAANDPSQVSQYQNFLNAQYQGPTGLQNYGDLSSKAQNFNQTTGLVNSDSGRMALLQKLYNNGNYSQGQQSLDNLLVSADPGQLQKLQSAQGLGNSVLAGLNTAQDSATQAGQQYTDWANQAKTTSAKTLQDAATGLDSDLSARASDQNSKATSDYAALQQHLASGQLTQQDLALINGTGGPALGADQLSHLYGTDLGTYFGKGMDATKQSIANQGDVSKMQALAKLGGSYVPNVGAAAQAYADPSQIGTYGGELTGSNGGIQGFLNQLNTNKNNFNTEYGNLISKAAYGQDGGAAAYSPDTIKNSNVVSTGSLEGDIAAIKDKQANGTYNYIMGSDPLAQLQAVLDRYGGNKGYSVQ